nr:hypothetical protein [Candidatus Woesearchaeota archaeon]
RLLYMNCFEELWSLFRLAEKPSKELTESYAFIHNMKKILHLKNETIFHIGDGAHARTGIMSSYLTQSVNISIDPQINHNLELFLTKWNTKYFDYYKGKYEDFTKEFHISAENYILSCVHAHVNLEDVVKVFPNWTYLYSNICCLPEQQTFSKKFLMENNIDVVVDKLDFGILSPERHIVIYKNNNLCSEQS